jgi:hypothetical protein
MNYRLALKAREPARTLYLAVPFDIYKAFFTLEFGQAAIQDYQLKLILYQVEQEVIVKWQN